jgi:hypothetical protein
VVRAVDQLRSYVDLSRIYEKPTALFGHAASLVYDDCPTDTRMRKADKVSIMYAKYRFGHASESMTKRVTKTNRTFSKVGRFV